jgi:MraZ protein
MNHFIGEYEVTLDAKGRFLVPAALKKQLDADTANQFVICRGIEKCLTLYPLQTWEPLFEEISKLNDFDPKVREFRRRFFNGATHISLDNAGRMLLPKALIDYAGLDKDIVLAPAVKQLEIWDAKKYNQILESSSPEGFSNLANEVMNKKREEGNA